MPDAQRQKAPVGLILLLLVAALIFGIAKYMWLDQFREKVLADEAAKQSQSDGETQPQED